MQEPGSGLMGSARRLAASLLSVVSIRLELLANELQEERLRLTQMFIFLLVALFCFGMALLLFTIFIVVLFWDTHRLAVLGGLSMAFLALGALAWLSLRNKVRQGSPLFSISLAELNKDKKHLETSHEQTDA